MSRNADLEWLLGAFNKAPALISRTREAIQNGKGLVDDWGSIAKRGEATYEKTHWGRKAPSGTHPADVPDPRGGIVEMGRLVAIEYLTLKGKRARVPAPYRHVFGPEELYPGDEGFDARELPILAFTEERPSGLVVVRDASDYTVTAHGIEG